MALSLCRVLSIAYLGCSLGNAIDPIFVCSAQAQSSSPAARASKLTAKQQFDRHVNFLDTNCVWHEYQFEQMGYKVCVMQEIVMAVAMDGPEGENGPTAYYKGGKLFAFRDTGAGTATMFDEKGRLLAEVEVGVVAPQFNKIKTKFTPVERREYTERATKIGKQLERIGYRWLKQSAS